MKPQSLEHFKFKTYYLILALSKGAVIRRFVAMRYWKVHRSLWNIIDWLFSIHLMQLQKRSTCQIWALQGPYPIDARVCIYVCKSVCVDSRTQVPLICNRLLAGLSTSTQTGSKQKKQFDCFSSPLPTLISSPSLPISLHHPDKKEKTANFKSSVPLMDSG